MAEKKEIYIKLLDEGTDVWRPILGEKKDEFIYKILSDKEYDPENEKWQFLP